MDMAMEGRTAVLWTYVGKPILEWSLNRTGTPCSFHSTYMSCTSH